MHTKHSTPPDRHWMTPQQRSVVGDVLVHAQYVGSHLFHMWQVDIENLTNVHSHSWMKVHIPDFYYHGNCCHCNIQIAHCSARVNVLQPMLPYASQYYIIPEPPYCIVACLQFNSFSLKCKVLIGAVIETWSSDKKKQTLTMIFWNDTFLAFGEYSVATVGNEEQ